MGGRSPFFPSFFFSLHSFFFLFHASRPEETDGPRFSFFILFFGPHPLDKAEEGNGPCRVPPSPPLFFFPFSHLSVGAGMKGTGPPNGPFLSPPLFFFFPPFPFPLFPLHRGTAPSHDILYRGCGAFFFFFFRALSFSRSFLPPFPRNPPFPSFFPSRPPSPPQTAGGTTRRPGRFFSFFFP